MTLIQTVKDIALERAKECAEEVGQKFLESVKPIYGASERSSPTPVAIGTCMFLKVSGERFLVTAAHVLDNHRVSTLYVGAGNSLQPIIGTFWETVAPEDDRDKDKFDFAFWRLSPNAVESLSDVVFIDESELSQNRGTMEGRQFLALGYPISRNKQISAQERHVQARAWTYQSSHFSPDERILGQNGFSRSHHLFLKYENRVGDYEGGVDNAINPRGASGGALIDLGLPSLDKLAQDAPCVGRLAGLFIERTKSPKLLVFVKIDVIVEQMRKSLASGAATDP